MHVRRKTGNRLQMMSFVWCVDELEVAAWLRYIVVGKGMSENARSKCVAALCCTHVMGVRGYCKGLHKFVVVKTSFTQSCQGLLGAAMMALATLFVDDQRKRNPSDHADTLLQP